MFSSLAKHGVWQNQSDLGHQYDDNDAGQHGKPERPDSSIYGVQRPGLFHNGLRREYFVLLHSLNQLLIQSFILKLYQHHSR